MDKVDDAEALGNIQEKLKRNCDDEKTQAPESALKGSSGEIHRSWSGMDNYVL